MKLPRVGPATALRSAAVGASATLVDLAALAVLVYALGIHERIASPIALLSGVGIQFVGNKLFAFRDGSRRWGFQALAFFSVEVLAFALNAIGFDLLVTSLRASPIPARVVVSAVVYFLFCLPLWSRVFSTRPAAQASVPG